MKRIMLHVAAFAALLPVVAVFSEGNLFVNIFGMLYFVWLAFWLCDTTAGRRFLREYYKEILRLEKELV